MTGSNEALADAVSGVVGTLVSLWCFYPIERIKTNLQAGRSVSSSSGWSSTTASVTSEKDSEFIQRKIKALVEFLRHSFRGCLTKSMHATSSSFCYFYFYSWILSFHNNKRRRRLQNGSNSSGNVPLKLAPLRPSTRLVLSAIAAMMNTFVTLPLDVLSSKRTVESENDEDKEMNTGTEPENPNNEENNKAMMEKTWNSIENNGGKFLPGLAASTSSYSSSTSSSASSTVEVVFHEACSRSEDLFALNKENDDQESDNNTSTYSSNSTGSSTSIVSYNEEYKLRWKERQEQLKSRRLRRKRQLSESNEPSNDAIYANKISVNAATKITDDVVAYIRRWSKLWKGLAPALLLCSNPSIHYTVFDMLKSKTLTWKRLRNHRGNHQHQLSVSEAFVLGLLSKFVATIVTYPLIRAKVLMMVRGDDPAPGTNATSQDGGNADNASSNTSSVSSTLSSPTLWSVLKESYYRDGGIPGLYKGCDWQLIHTLLKSALMMAIREQITDTSRALFGVSSR